jgi:hypothetical protein
MYWHLNIGVSPPDVVEQGAVVELEAGLGHGVGGKVDFATHLNFPGKKMR